MKISIVLSTILTFVCFLKAAKGQFFKTSDDTLPISPYKIFFPPDLTSYSDEALLGKRAGK